MRVAFVGELLDDANRPISGIFPLEFRLYRNGEAETPVWTEQQHVAVYEGMYEVHLGRVNGIPAEWVGQERVVEVALGDVALSRQPLLLARWNPEGAGAPTIRHERTVDLAGTAISADEAGFAHNCRTLGGQNLASLDHYAELRDQLDELRERIDRPAGNRIGTEVVTLPRIGGEDGFAYEYRCPPGFVMTGARGGDGQLIDGFRIICTQLQ